MNTFSLRALIATMLFALVLSSCHDELSLTKNDVALNNADIKAAATKSEQEIKYEMHGDSLITDEMTKGVIEAVKPVKEIIERLLNDDKTGIYSAYKKDTERYNALKSNDDKRALATKMYKNYLSFFKGIWKKADIDEKTYQEKIKGVFPDEIRNEIEFTDFLNFSIQHKHTRGGSPVPPPPPAPAPDPKLICVDAMTLAFGLSESSHFGDAGASAMSYHYGMYASTGASIAGTGKALAGTAGNITIPGTFPSDDNVLRVKKSFRWNGNVTALSVIGCSFATAQYTTIMMEESLTLWAPVIFINIRDFNEPHTEEYIIKKQFLYNIRYGLSVYSFSFGEIAAGSTAWSGGNDFTWSICEEKKPD